MLSIHNFERSLFGTSERFRFSFVLVALFSMCGGATPLIAQGPLKLNEANMSKVFRNNVRPVWLGEDRFYYRVNVGPDREQFVLVDVPKRTKTVASSLEELQIDPNEIQPDSNRQPPGRPNRIRRSGRDSSERITVTFKNESGAAVQLFWFDSGRQSHAYHEIPPNGTVKQSTFAGHSWYAVDANKKPIWTAIAQSDAQVFSIKLMELEPPFPGETREEAPNRSGSPDGKWQAKVVPLGLQFESKDGSDQFLVPATDATKAANTTPNNDQSPSGAFEDRLHWSPDSSMVVVNYITFGEHRELTLIESSPKDSLQPRVIRQRYDKPGDRLDRPTPVLIDMATKKIVPLSNDLIPEPWSIDEYRWAKDSSSFTFLYNQRGHQVLRIIKVDAKSGAATAIVDEQAKTYVDYAAKAFHQYLDESNELLWASERDGWYHLYLYDTKAGQLKNQVTRGEWVIRGIEHIDTTARQVWFYAGGIAAGQDPYQRQLCRVDFDGNNLVRLTDGDGDHQCSFSPDRKYIIDTYSRVDLPPVRELRDAKTGEKLMELERAEIDKLIEAGWKQPERFTAKGRDDSTDIYGIIVRPSVIEPGRKYPIIEAIYAGPQDSFVPKSFGIHREFYELAEKGFIVVKIDGMGTSNRSKAFHDVSWKNLSDGGFIDRKKWIKAAAEKYPEMDSERVGIYGGSAGGQNALAALLWHGDFYDAAVADCGCHDNRMDKVWWNELYMSWPIGPHYAANSNVDNAHRLQGKLLLTVGELDTNVDPASTMQVVNALIKANKEFELLVFPGGGHGVGSSEYGRIRRDEFFIRHLQKN